MNQEPIVFSKREQETLAELKTWNTLACEVSRYNIEEIQLTFDADRKPIALYANGVVIGEIRFEDGKAHVVPT